MTDEQKYIKDLIDDSLEISGSEIDELFPLLPEVPVEPFSELQEVGFKCIRDAHKRRKRVQ